MNYRSKQVLYNNILFDSESECLFYQELLKRNDIENIEIHREFILIPPFYYMGKQVKATVYTPDFVYYDKKLKRNIVVEIKGFAKSDYELRLKLWKYKYGNDYDFVELTYSKTLGFKETKEHKKEMKKLRTQKAIDRAFKQEEEKKLKIERLRHKIEKRIQELKGKAKLTANDLKSLKNNELKLKELIEQEERGNK